MKKQILSLLLVIIMISSLLSLVACDMLNSTTSTTSDGSNVEQELEGEKVIGEVVLLAASLSPTQGSSTSIYLKPINNSESLPVIRFVMKASQITSSNQNATTFGKGSKAEITYIIDEETGDRVAIAINILDDATTTDWPEQKFDPTTVINQGEETTTLSATVMHIVRVEGGSNGYIVYVKTSPLILQGFWVKDGYTTLDSTVEELINSQSTEYKVNIRVPDVKTSKDDIILAHSLEIVEENDKDK